MTDLTWTDVLDLVAKLSSELGPARKVFGIPRGGSIVAGLLSRHGHLPVSALAQAEVLVDDIVDSGRTEARWQSETGLRLLPLLDKRVPPWTGHWIRFPWEHADGIPSEEAVARLLETFGLDLASEGLRDTPRRVASALGELLRGYHSDPSEVLDRTFPDHIDEMVVVRDVPFWSLCEHHVLPFHGHVTVGYVPKGKVVGLSKIPRMVAIVAAKLQVQERLTTEIADTLFNKLAPAGVGVLVRARHTCMEMRGVRSAGEMVTSCLLGVFREGKARDEFLRLSGGGPSAR